MSTSDRRHFVHLHNHTNFSLLDGATRIDRLVDHCCKQGMRAVAITDHGNMFGAVQFYRSARDSGLKPILGMEAYLAAGSLHDRGNARSGRERFHQLLLAKDRDGYRNLMKLSSVGYLEGFYYKPRIDKEILASHSQGLIATSSCLSGEVPQHLLRGDSEGARAALVELVDIFGHDNVYVELQDQGLPEQQQINPELIRLAGELELPLIATNDCHYLLQADARAHDALLCIQTGKAMSEPQRMKFPNNQFYVKTPEEMWKVFAEVPEALVNTEKVAERCNVVLNFGENHLPRFPVPEGETPTDYLEKVVRGGFERRLDALRCVTAGNGGGSAWAGKHAPEEYHERLETELSTIASMGFAGYFLIVWDFIRYAREAGIPVGPGRGSAAGSLVAYSLGITDIDPLEYGLFFERFLNPERISLPDIDIDFCMRRRGEVIDYVADKYGRDRVAHIITFGTMAAKAAIRDVGRVMDLPYGDVDRVAKLIPNELDTTLDGAVKSVPALQEAIDKDPRVAELVDLARQLEGQVRHASTHAAGVVIADQPLTDYVPLYCPPVGSAGNQEHAVATQYPMNDVEAIGLLKMDFLGLKTLTVVHDALESIARETGTRMTSADIPIDDAETFKIFAAGTTSGIFQFESSGMRDALRKLGPSRIEDLIAMNALYRPGPIGSGMIDEYIRRKHDPAKVKYLLPQLEEIQKETYGVIVYQEQVMQIASELAGFTLGEADVLRKAMGKKKPEVMASMEEKFIGGCKVRDVPSELAKEIWDQVVEFAGYGFIKAHSAAYALLAYQTAYLKANYPVHFVAALLTSDRDVTDKVVRYISECRDIGIPVLPPDVNESYASFTAAGNSIRFGLAAVKGVGEGAVLAILEARERLASFSSLYEFCEEVDLGKGINRRTIESLIKCGAFDSVMLQEGAEPDPGDARAKLMAMLDGALDSGQRRQRERRMGQKNLFADLETDAGDVASLPPELPASSYQRWEDRDILTAEKESLGFYITGHPLERYRRKLEDFANATTADLPRMSGAQEVALGAIITGIRDLKTRKGERMAVLQVEDLEGYAEVVVFPDAYRACFNLLNEDEAVLISGRPEAEDDAARMIASDIQSLTEFFEQEANAKTREVLISVTLGGLPDEVPEQLRDLLERHRGEVPVSLRLQRPHPNGFRAHVAPNRFLWVTPSPELVNELEDLLGQGSVRLRR